MSEEFSAGVIVATNTQPRKYLVLHYGSGHWEYPRGNIEEGESEEETARRECEEETGITELDFVDGFREVTKWIYTREGNTIHKTATYLLATTSQTDVKLSHEHQGYQWLEFGDTMKRTTFANAKEVLKKAQNRLKQ